METSVGKVVATFTIMFSLFLLLPLTASAESDPATHWKPCPDRPANAPGTCWRAVSSDASKIVAEVGENEDGPQVFYLGKSSGDHTDLHYIASSEQRACDGDTLWDVSHANPSRSACIRTEQPPRVTLIVPLSRLGTMDEWFGDALSWHNLENKWDHHPVMDLVVYDAVSGHVETAERFVAGNSHETRLQAATKNVLSRQYDWQQPLSPESMLTRIGEHLEADKLVGGERHTILVYDTTSMWSESECKNCFEQFTSSLGLLPSGTYTVINPALSVPAAIEAMRDAGNKAVAVGQLTPEQLHTLAFDRYQVVEDKVKKPCPYHDHSIQEEGKANWKVFFIAALLLWYTLGMLVIAYVWMRRRK